MHLSTLLCVLLSLPYLCFAQEDDSEKQQEMISNTRELRALIQSDPHRPIYHFVAPEGHTVPFDPNGAIYWEGKYHLGYIYQKKPSKTISLDNGHVWGHAVSTDLFHWTLYPDMLDLKEGDLEKGIFSGGSFLSKEGVPHVIYHGVGANANLIAYSADKELKAWKKLGNKSALISPDGADPFDNSAKYTVFDPDAWYDKKADTYYQISGGMKPALFKSKDMTKWEYLDNLFDKNNTMHEPYEDISCPDFFSLGDKSMLIFISHTLGAQYYIGNFANEKFIPEKHGRMNWPGGTFFAPEQLQDAKGRNIIWGWVTQPRVWPPNPQDKTSYPEYGWSGIMSLPRVVSLSDMGTLQINPPEEIQAIRLTEVQENNIILKPNAEATLQTSGKSIELKVEISGGAHAPFGVKVFASHDGREETVIRYEPESEQLVIDFINSSINGPVSIPVFDPERYDSSKSIWDQFNSQVSEQKAPLKLQKGETLQLDIFLDRSVIEVFANGRQVMTQVVYPELDTSTGVKVFSGSEAVAFKNIRSWTMAETNAY